MSRKLVVFDFDGTLVSSQQGFDDALTEFSVARGMPYDLRKMSTGYVDPSQYDLGWGLQLDQQEAMLTEFCHFVDHELTVNKRFIADLFDDIHDALIELKKQFAFGIVTARSRVPTLAILEHHGLKEFFPTYRTMCCVRERNYRIKPEPDALICLMKEMDYKPEDVVMVGDTTSDILMANAAGVKSIGVLWGAHPEERLLSAKPTLMIHGARQLPDAVHKIFA